MGKEEEVLPRKEIFPAGMNYPWKAPIQILLPEAFTG